MRRCFKLQAPPGVLSILSDLAQPRTSTSYQELLRNSHLPAQPLPFLPPPRWAAELSRVLHRTFPDVVQHHHTRFLQVFVHPSFTTAAGVSGTMQPLVAVGESLLERIGGLWILATFESTRREEYASLLALLTSDTALCRVLRDHWRLEHMVLTDASADLFSRQRLSSTKGLVCWLSSHGNVNGAQSLPEPFGAGCVKAMVAAVLLEHGNDAAEHFVKSEVLPYVL
ncbi:conserved hypothetical protein [Leishmania major strain Friedlin]|uniref:RNase III domain-containing protein n=1 Tax=Leishmania major TaxID=5664 RepID=E9ADA8_LEIMA|nr:conserved hypothetical protein [Leishmania major strain Friedlin]CAG9576735.1 hypothetical_protein_-_conserved [Leishmania major strain Friedlin]CBZ12195.1 conserved hypothetical protein [Leishmania major strain Friedlin]|eukprot:XP_003721937.1 conserved hypothetical protein [Leishmania major strain Friedlin]